MIQSQISKTTCRYSQSPTELFAQLTQDKHDVMLLESAEINSKDNLKSLLLVSSALKITCQHRQVTFTALNDNGLPLIVQLKQHFTDYHKASDQHLLTIEYPQPPIELDQDLRLKAPSPFSALRDLQQLLSQGSHDQHRFIAGTFAYDMIASIEDLPEVQSNNNHCPDFVFYLIEDMVMLDHQGGESVVISHQFNPALTDVINQKHQALVEQVNNFEPNELVGAPITTPVQVNIDDDSFKGIVNGLKQQIIQGNIFQVVPSRAFTMDCPNPFAAYNQLKATNPSPYMFYIKDADFVLFGASPESALKYEQLSNQVEVYPIAGTRRRGFNSDGSINPDLDGRMELDLRLDKKELAEHIMLVDLARNDVARISEAGTRQVAELLKVDRYSHVMHLVSRVTGQLRNDLDALHAYQACMNMGTLVGAPKIKASALIRDVEQQRRGSYGGAVGYINSAGDMDTCIVIRSAFVSNGKAVIQAGAGVVFDSDPQAEADETRSKAQAVISAIAAKGGFYA
ncbi:anthranilate synthase component 1 [Psychrobium sp. 1_MG-2023]|uniref:anthranilate synthase component 1 n=1 Tax=Psychrobium sp. 1_MG-2023 TaxID=3062624 RepID=UPI000C338AF2|nr:anthranilate synthase component 1 [Psychrobium sp. 1_MG-2023]MDP2560236.1 anthranilate synthase component 1 [Psychrobium sp. 1_MG-2023]PKF57046.1 anthranilate synthase component I [Alteromonadales bacterium alter-6D02]